MSIGVQSRRLNRAHALVLKGDRWYIVASILLQLVLGFLFGHVYDQRIYMATGYLVASGQNPYIPQDLSTIFHNPAFQGMTSIGYPPPWPLLLGAIYALSYGLVPNLLLYNLAIKLPIIAANLGLAYLVKTILESSGAEPAVARKAWIFLLFNPFLLYFTTAWGQFDSIVTVLTLLALVFVHKQKTVISALLLAVAISTKPISIPVVLVIMVYLWGKPWRRLVTYLAVLAVGTLLLCVAPFVILHWDPDIILTHWNAIFTMNGGLSLMSYYELLNNTYQPPGMWWLLGFLWLPAILVGTWLIRHRVHDLMDLLKKSLALILIFYLTRTWLSEPNLTLVLPFVLILTSLKQLPRISLTATWVLPLIFTVFNTSPPQLLFPILPDMMEKLLHWMDIYRPARLMARMLVVIPWQINGWWMVLRGLRRTTPA